MMIEQAANATSSGDGMDRRLTRPRGAWRRYRWALAALTALMLALLVWRLVPASGSTDVASADLDIGTVQQAAFDDYLPVRATVAPAVTTLVGAMAGGQVERLLVQDGAMVSAGQPLATLANAELKLDVLTREAQIVSQLGDVSGQDLSLERNKLDRAAQIAQANYDLIKARRELSVRQILHDKGLIADAGVRGYAEEEAYQRTRLAQLQSGQAEETRITATQAQRLVDTRARLSGNLAAVRAGLDALVIRAQAGGRLTNFTLQPGQTLKAGDTAGQIDSEGAWKLVADVDEFYLRRVAVGQHARIDATRMTVSKVLPAVKDGRFRVELSFDGAAPAGLSRGQTLDVRITLGAASRAVVAPVGGWLDQGGTSAFVIDRDGAHAYRRAVTVGRRNPETVEVLHGLTPGERIVTSSTATVKSDILNLR